MNTYPHKEWVSPGELVMPEIRVTHPRDKRILLRAGIRFYDVSEDTEILGVVIQLRLKKSRQIKGVLNDKQNKC